MRVRVACGLLTIIGRMLKERAPTARGRRHRARGGSGSGGWEMDKQESPGQCGTQSKIPKDSMVPAASPAMRFFFPTASWVFFATPDRARREQPIGGLGLCVRARVSSLGLARRNLRDLKKCHFQNACVLPSLAPTPAPQCRLSYHPRRFSNGGWFSFP